ncbi:MAG: lipid-A-disaccharide synthase [Nitrospirae bacterium]|nr:lipid-A-disaccharide synthase [Nitrospirota bacterium]
MPCVMIIAGESSGELYGSLLAKELIKKSDNIQLIGIGGERMKETGVELISSISDAFGLTEALKSLKKLKRAYNNSLSTIKTRKPDVLVLIDYPDFNLKLAKEAKKLGIKILYYVSPQVWAWRRGRVRKIAELVDMIAVILPFEEKIYKDAGVRCEFVGHPVMEEIEEVSNLYFEKNQSLSFSIDAGFRNFFKTSIGARTDSQLIALLPGSRPHELEKLLPLMIDIVKKFKSDTNIFSKSKFQFCMPLAPNVDENRYSILLDELKNEGVLISKGNSVKVLASSDIAVVASGTATLQTALLEVPMIVVYKLSPLTFFLGKKIIRVSHISLVNILSGNKDVVKELLQDNANPAEVLKELKRIIFDTTYKNEMLNNLRKIKSLFAGKKPSERVADIVLELAGK